MDAGAVGNVALWGAVVSSATAAATAAGRGLTRGATTLASAAGIATLVLATASVGALAWSLLTGDFSLAYVADTTTRQGAWPYRLAGLWGGNGGSLLLWAWIILLAGLWATRRRPVPSRVVAAATGGVVLLVAAVAANPFQRLAMPAIDGGGLSPILRYPAMLYHPPLLYAGHAGLAAPFVLALAGLATGQLDRDWLASTRRWMLVAWLLLGIGLLTGAHWSYVELGWGGFWAWDPVENGGLLPLLASTVFLHRARRAPTTDDGRFFAGLAGLAALPLCLSLLGATLSRSGAAQSVHAFAQAGAVGLGLLAVLATAVIVTVTLVVRARSEAISPGRPQWDRPLWSEDRALVGAVLLLLAVVLAVAVGTAFPAVLHSVGGDRIAVTSRYYAVVLTPMVLLLAVLMGVGPGLRTGAAATRPPGTGRGVPATRRAAVAASVAAGAAVFTAFGGPRQLVPAVLGAAGAIAMVMTVAELTRATGLRRAGALLAHAGIALLLAGVAGSLRGRQSTQVLRLGATVELDGFSLHYRDVATEQGAGWRRVTVILDVSRHGQAVGVLRPGLRVFDDQAAALSEVAMRSTVARDLIVAVRQIDPASRAAQLDTTVRPLVVLVWWGGLLAAAGGFMVLAVAFGASRPAPPTRTAATTPVSTPAARAAQTSPDAPPVSGAARSVHPAPTARAP